MVNKPLLYGISGFILGGLVVSLAAATFDKQDLPTKQSNSSYSTMSMEQMTTSLVNKTGDTYDKEFMSSMIAHHQAAVAMAKLSTANAKHTEIKQLSQDIIKAQEKEITEMKQWQAKWGYGTTNNMNSMDHMSR
jgi:uncharacterized protein (DUF305 family)